MQIARLFFFLGSASRNIPAIFRAQLAQLQVALIPVWQSRADYQGGFQAFWAALFSA
ncbi:hypothetical protein [Cupriavidus necator]|uniref:hypothetical protein n=1 Tax=Cupriavidus necator TaxID=106590 RepID=UPI0013DF128C|nr:hypothetical protein [Cupriavidus necator]